ncbi:MAG: response regulator [Chloroflexota bacterium]|nr:MAG: response regulator [Chloroflexota bacterium]
MQATSLLVTRYIQEAAPLLADYAGVLRGWSSNLAAVRGEFVAQWQALVERDGIAQNLRGSDQLLEQATRVLVDALATEQDAAKYLRDAAAWGAELRTRGADYVDLTRLFHSLRRAVIATGLRNYPAGPDLELLFQAMDVHERVVLGVLAVSDIEATQAQLLEGAHQRSLGQMTGGIIHSLNNTMTMLVGRAQILEEQATEESQRQELQTIQKIARSGAESLKRLQQFAAERDGREPTRIEVNALLNDVVQLTRFRWRDDAEASGISIEVIKDLAPASPVIGQMSALRDALVELILNSVEAMPHGGIITIRTEQREDQVQITIADQGEGMDGATQGRAVEALFTTKGASHLGLGLTTVSNAVRGMGGKFTLESEPGQGTRAILLLPRASEIQMAPDLRSTRLTRWANILVVDDEPLVRDITLRTFQRRGFRTVTAESGTAAIRVFTEEGPFQVVLVDLGMPGMNGFETAHALKQLNPRTIIILMSGWGAEFDPAKLREAGIDRTIAKPYDVDQVIQLIGEALAIQERI